MLIIDLDRLNQLTAHPNESNDRSYGSTSIYSISKKIVSKYITIYIEGDYKKVDQYDEAVATLKYNKILIDKSDIRDGKIDKLLNLTDPDGLPF